MVFLRVPAPFRPPETEPRGGPQALHGVQQCRPRGATIPVGGTQENDRRLIRYINVPVQHAAGL